MNTVNLGKKSSKVHFYDKRESKWRVRWKDVEGQSAGSVANAANVVVM